MVLPPGREAVSVPGFDATVNPNLTRAAGEVAAWVDYLLHPEEHDGPRVYRSRTGAGENPFPSRNEELDSRPNEYETVSLLEDFADDPEVFVRPVQAIAGLRHELISDTYDKLLMGYLTVSTTKEPPGSGAIEKEEGVINYPEMHPIRDYWQDMRDGWEGEGRPEANQAALYETAFIRYQVVTENCLYIVAEHLARYWAIFNKAGRDMLELMDAFTKECSDYKPPVGEGFNLNIGSIVLDAIIGAAVAVITGGIGTTIREALKDAADEGLKNALHQAADGPKKKQLILDTHYWLRDTARQYLDGVKAIEREVADAVAGLADSLRTRLDTARDRRTYKSDIGESVESVPRVPDFKHTTL